MANTKVSQPPDDSSLSPDQVAALTNLKAVYDSLNKQPTETGPKAKRDLNQFLQDVDEDPTRAILDIL